MPEGTISRYDIQRGFGFIKPQTGGPDVFFHVGAVRDTPPDRLTPGTRVSYEVEQGPRGLRARGVRVIAATPIAPAAKPAPGSYRFLNPYNFVRPLDAKDPKAAPLLGRCPPPTHDRYVGLTGRIGATLTATTPLFVADSGAAEEDPTSPGHLSYRFFQYGGQPAIPGSSLRGAVRSIFEAATNSCFAVFAGDKRLSYHLPATEAPLLVPARLTRNDAGWQAELLTGMTPLARGRRPEPQYAAWVPFYQSLRASRTRTSAPQTPYSRRRLLDPKPWHHGDQCEALVELIQHPRGFSFWSVVQLAKPGTRLRSQGSGQRQVTGHLCITNQNIDNKHDERLFFRDPGQPAQAVAIDEAAIKRYEDLITDYQDRHGDEVARRGPDEAGEIVWQDPAFSWFVYERVAKGEAKVKPGDLVYAMLSRAPQPLGIDFIVPVSVPRVGYRRRVADLLPAEHGKCKGRDTLCPACRTFGWVADPPERDSEEDKPVAYAGRVRISHATLIGRPEEHTMADDIVLSILSTPKPTTTRFYLAPASGRPGKNRDDDNVGYDAPEQQPQRLRGRKVYRHQGERVNAHEYRSPGDARTDQNRTLRGVIRPGGRFEFNVDFENLAPVEVGALLWTLNIDGWHHRVGLAKPLGFGSARIEVSRIELLDTARRYESLTSRWRDGFSHMDAWVRGFHTAMAERYGRAFHDLDNIRDLRALLEDTPRLPVHYPRPSRMRDPNAPSYEWFMGNKRSGRDAGPRLELPLAAEDQEGLPVMDRYGRLSE